MAVANREIATEELVAPRPAENQEFKALGDFLRSLRSSGHTVLKSSSGEEVKLPASAFEVLNRVADAMSHGKPIALVPYGQTLTTKQAADLLHISRPFLVRKLLGVEIPFEKVGSHHRLRLDDVLAYREKRHQARSALLDQMAAEAQTFSGGYR